MTCTSTSPGSWDGAVTVISVSLTITKSSAVSPSKVTEVAPVNPDPVSVTVLPPSTDPLVGSRESSTEASARKV